MDEKISEFLEKHYKCYDRFTFDKLMRFLLSNGYDHEDAKDLILYNCALSALVTQERIDNDYYLGIKCDNGISEDLAQLTNQVLKNEYIKPN